MAQKYKKKLSISVDCNIVSTGFSIEKCRIFAAALAKGMPCKSATVPAAVNLRKTSQLQTTVLYLGWEGDWFG